MPKLNAAELNAGLSLFHGTESFYQHINSRYRYTEGVHFLVESAGAYWLLDAIISWQHDPKVAAEAFQQWRLRRVQNSSAWELWCEDGEGKRIAEQQLSFSDFPLEGIDLYCINSTVLLTGEY